MERESPKNFIVILLLEMNTYSIDKGVTIRAPSTANLMVDCLNSINGANDNPGLRQFTASQAFQNGFFTRVGVTEFILQYNIPNVVGTDLSGFQFTCDISGTTSNTLMRVPNGSYNVAELIDAVVAAMNANGSFGTVSVQQNYINPTNAHSSAQVAIYATGGFRFSASQPSTNLSGTIQTLLGVPLGGPWATRKAIGPQPLSTNQVRYLDFVSNQLTYAQDLKDANTTSTPYDVLLRWYFSYTDQQPLLDKYGYTIPYASYSLNERRLFNPPKQIKWDSNLPLGNFQVEVLVEQSGITNTPPAPISQYIDRVSAITGQTKSSMLSYLFTLQLTEN